MSRTRPTVGGSLQKTRSVSSALTEDFRDLKRDVSVVRRKSVPEVPDSDKRTACSSTEAKVGTAGSDGRRYESEDGEPERTFLMKVIQGDSAWVAACLNSGKEILFSTWGGGLTKTSILYAAKAGDTEMCKILMAFGGKDMLKVRDVKHRDGQFFAKKHGLDLMDLMRSGMRIDCWNYKALSGKDVSFRAQHILPRRLNFD